MPAYDRRRDVVPVAAIYGANASGKSNLLGGLRLMANLVRRSPLREPGTGVPRQPNRPQGESEPSVFVVGIVARGVRFTYGFSVNDEQVLEEWLYSYPHNKKRVLFERELDGINFGSTVQHRREAELIERAVRPESLFLGVAARLDFADVLDAYSWFQRTLRFPRLDSFLSERRVTQFIERSEQNRGLLLELLRSADFGIVDVGLERESSDESMPAWIESEIKRSSGLADSDDFDDLALRSFRRGPEKPGRQTRLSFVHGNGAKFVLGDESAGTRSWLFLLPDLLDCLETGSVLIVDEIDTSLHPLLVRKLIEIFRSPKRNPHGGQLVFTTHDAYLLAPVEGEAALERDQVWFVEKPPDGVSRLYPLSDFHPRNEHNLARRYLGGAYGAVPFLDDLDDIVVPAQTDGSTDH